jgi:hypothetical protein
MDEWKMLHNKCLFLEIFKFFFLRKDKMFILACNGINGVENVFDKLEGNEP